MKDIISLPVETPGPGLDSKYRLCVVAAQRALQVIKGSAPRINNPYYKPTSLALAEVQEGLVPFAEGDDAFKAREKDESTYKVLLTETRTAYVDDDGNPLFNPPMAPTSEPANRPSVAAPAAKD